MRDVLIDLHRQSPPPPGQMLIKTEPEALAVLTLVRDTIYLRFHQRSAAWQAGNQVGSPTLFDSSWLEFEQITVTVVDPSELSEVAQVLLAEIALVGHRQAIHVISPQQSQHATIAGLGQADLMNWTNDHITVPRPTVFPKTGEPEPVTTATQLRQAARDLEAGRLPQSKRLIEMISTHLTRTADAVDHKYSNTTKEPVRADPTW